MADSCAGTDANEMSVNIASHRLQRRVGPDERVPVGKVHTGMQRVAMGKRRNA